jgi:FkbM family methyltransferase
VPGLLPRALALGHDAVSVLRCPELTSHGKLSLLWAKARYHARRLRHDAIVDCGVARIRFGAESFLYDWYVFEEIFMKRIYRRLRLESACVLDLGAHKGYFAAFALAHGASNVVSFEPEATNFRRLATAAEGVARWTARQEAIAGESGVRALQLNEAWSHSLVARDDGDDVVTVAAVSLGDVLQPHAGKRQVVKVDIEGAECEALARTSPDLLARVDELVVEAHAGAGCEPARIVAIAEGAGLQGVHIDLDHPAPVLHFRAPGEQYPGPLHGKS